MSITAWFIFGAIMSFVLGGTFVTVRLANVLKMSVRDLLILILTISQVSQDDPPDDDDF